MPDDRDYAAVSTDFALLIEAIALRRDRDAFTQLFEFFAPRVKSLMIRSGSVPAQAEELAHDTLLAVWHKAHLFDPAGASASGWIYKIARNLRIDAIRRERRDALIVVDRSDVPEESAQPLNIVVSREEESRVRAAVALLSEEQQKVIALSFFEDRPHAEISRLLSLPLGTVKSRLRLATKRLRDVLDDFD